MKETVFKGHGGIGLQAEISPQTAGEQRQARPSAAGIIKDQPQILHPVPDVAAARLPVPLAVLRQVKADGLISLFFGFSGKVGREFLAGHLAVDMDIHLFRRPSPDDRRDAVYLDPF